MTITGDELVTINQVKMLIESVGGGSFGDFDIRKSLEECTWSEIDSLAQNPLSALYAKSFWSGQSKSVTINGYGTHNFVFADVGVDSDSMFTFVCEDLIGFHSMSAPNPTSAGWESCAMRSWLSSTIFSALPSDLQSVIKSVPKKNTAGYGSKITYDKLWIPSYTEVGIGTGDSEGRRYFIFTDDASRIKNRGKTAYLWWLRSVNSSTYFRCVQKDGSLTNGGASGSLGACPCFCI